MQRKHQLLAMAFFAAGLSVITLGQAAPAQAAEPSASDCVSVLRTEKSNGLEMSVSNACGRGLACEMRWTLQCETAAGKVTQKAPGASRFAMEASGGSVVTASAAACKDSWTVTEVTWTCAGR